MTPTEAKQQFRRIFTLYPSIRQFVESLEDAQGTIDAWCGILSPCEPADVTAVVDAVCAGKAEAVGQFQKPDAMPHNIRRAAMDIKNRREAKQQQDDKYHKPIRQKVKRVRRDEPVSMPRRGEAWNTVQSWHAGRWAVWLGEQVREGKLTREENDRRMDELLAWDKGGEVPDWLQEASS